MSIEFYALIDTILYTVCIIGGIFIIACSIFILTAFLISLAEVRKERSYGPPNPRPRPKSRHEYKIKKEDE